MIARVPGRKAESIDAKERELARLQTESIPMQLEANFARGALESAMATALSMAKAAKAALHELSGDFQDSADRLSDDLGGDKRDDNG